MFFQCINIRQVPREVLKTAASGLGFQHLPRDLANVNALKKTFLIPILFLYRRISAQAYPGSSMCFLSAQLPKNKVHVISQICLLLYLF